MMRVYRADGATLVEILPWAASAHELSAGKQDIISGAGRMAPAASVSLCVGKAYSPACSKNGRRFGIGARLAP
jgi:hypothetical protein